MVTVRIAGFRVIGQVWGSESEGGLVAGPSPTPKQIHAITGNDKNDEVSPRVQKTQ